MILTWGEFKKIVDTEISKMNLNDNVEIAFIDITPYQDDSISVDGLIGGLEIITYLKDSPKG